MRRVGGLLLVVLCACAGLLGAAASAGAEVRPFDEGGMVFGTITGPLDPEDYSFSVELGEGQKLRLVDEQHAEVFYEEGFTAFSIAAMPAHDANGANVPTTLSVTQPDILTLTVHHREGNPAAGDAPFTYPIIGGAGWEGGFRTTSFPIEEPHPQASTPAPAATAAPSQPNSGRVLVTRALGDPTLYFRPHSFLLSADGTFGVGKVQWTDYGEAVATATGRGFANDCIPNCSAGRFYHPQANLRLSRIVTCQGKSVYARLHYALTGPLPKGFPRQGGFSMLPLGEDGKPDC